VTKQMKAQSWSRPHVQLLPFVSFPSLTLGPFAARALQVRLATPRVQPAANTRAVPPGPSRHGCGGRPRRPLAVTGVVGS
jgi:hypothetical protein